MTAGNPNLTQLSRESIKLHHAFADKFQTLFKTNIFETGVSDHHKMISIIMKPNFVMESSRRKYYQKYFKFDVDYFSSEHSRLTDSAFSSIKENEHCEELCEFSRFHRIFLNHLNVQHVLKKAILRANNNLFMTKSLRKAIVIRPRLKSDENWSLYKTQRNFYLKMLRRLKKIIFQR